MPKFRKKPIVIDAIRWTGDNYEAIKKLTGGRIGVTCSNVLFIDTLEGVMQAQIWDYIIKGVKGECYPCKPDIFEATYEKVE